MNTFTIENDTNNITAHASADDAAAVTNALSFHSQTGLAELAADWSAARLVAIWNGLPGVTPVKKFTNRDTAVKRIWAAVQHLGQRAAADFAASEDADDSAGIELDSSTESGSAAETSEPELPTTEPFVGAPAPDVSPGEEAATSKATGTKRPRPAAKEDGAPRTNKTETIMALLKSERGATLNEIMTATGLQTHSVRGFLSGTIRKKMGLEVISVKAEEGSRTYSVKA